MSSNSLIVPGNINLHFFTVVHRDIVSLACLVYSGNLETSSNTWGTVMYDVEDLCSENIVCSIRVCVWNVLTLMLDLWDKRSPSTSRSRQYSFTFMSFPISFFYSYELSMSTIFCAIELSRLGVERIHGGSWRMSHTLLTLCQIPTENKSYSLLWVKGN